MASSRSIDLPDLSGLTVLVVDDDDDALDLLSTLVRACGANSLLARSAIGALAYVDSTPKLDLIVTDLAMPVMDGREFARKVRSHPSRRTVPIIGLTAFYEQYPPTSDFDVYLKKPVNLDALCAAMKTAVRRGRP